MKSHFLCLTFVTVCWLNLPGEPAAAQNRARIHGAVGLTKAVSPTNFSNRYRIGFISGAAVGYELVKYGFEPVVSGTYSRYMVDPEAVGGSSSEIDGGDRSMWGVSVGTYFHMNSGTMSYNGRRHLYLIGQIGLRGLHIGAATVRTTEGNASWEKRTEIRPGVVVGLGMEFPIVDQFSFKLEPALDVMFTRGERTSALLLNSGLIFSRQ